MKLTRQTIRNNDILEKEKIIYCFLKNLRSNTNTNTFIMFLF